MDIQQVQCVFSFIKNSPLMIGLIGGGSGAFLTIAASLIVPSLEANLNGWKRKVLYLLAGAIAGGLINYHTSAGILPTAMIGMRWTILVVTPSKTVKALFEKIVGASISENSKV